MDELCDEARQLQKMFRSFVTFGRTPTDSNASRLVGLVTVEVGVLSDISEKFKEAGERSQAHKVERLAEGLDEVRLAVLAYLDGDEIPSNLPDTTSLLSAAYAGVDCRA